MSYLDDDAQAAPAYRNDLIKWLARAAALVAIALTVVLCALP